MNVWAIQATRYIDAWAPKFNQWLKEGKFRVCDSWDDTFDLRLPDHKRRGFDRLLEIKKGDWIVYVNVPQWGRCSAARITSEYGFDKGHPNYEGDFRHVFDVDTSTFIEFDRNDKNVLPHISRKLKPRRKFQRVYCEDDFLKSIENLKGNTVEIEEGETKQTHYLKDSLEPMLGTIVTQIQHTHKGKDLESLLADVFKKVPDVDKVKNNGSGWGTDNGADLLVRTKSIDIAGLEIIPSQKVVVQVKSYEGEIYDLNAVDQIVNAIECYKADAGIIATTAKSTDGINQRIAEEEKRIGKPIYLLAHEELARFVIEHASDLLF